MQHRFVSKLPRHGGRAAPAFVALGLLACMAFYFPAATPIIAQTSDPKGAAKKAAPQAQKEKEPPVDAEPQSTSATFGDWTLQCRRVGTGSAVQKTCEVAQSITIQGQQAPVAQVAIGRVNPTEPLTLTIVMPLNVAFPSTPRLSLKGGAAGLDLTWARCLPAGCFANARPTDDILRQWRTAADPKALIQSSDAAGRKFELGASFRGLAQALDAMAK